MKIIQVNTVNNSGSTGRITEDLGNAINSIDGKSFIAAGRNIGFSKSIEYKIGNSFDLVHHFLLTRLLDKHGFGSKKSTINLIRRIQEIDPDIIHLHNIHGYYINLPELFTFIKSSNSRVVWTFHDCWAFTGHCTYFDSVNCFKWKNKCHNCPKTGAYPKSWIIDNSKQNFFEKKKLFTGIKKLTIVTPSQWLKNHVENSFMNEYDTIMIHNGIDLNVFQPRIDEKFLAANKLKGFDILLGVASTWDTRKGFNDFISLADRIDDNFKIVLIGLSKRQKKELPENVLAISRTENTIELSKWYSVANVFINPTYQDNFPTTNIEALACGTPVITYNTGGSIESIDQNTGVVVEKGSINGLINGINRISESKETYTKDLCRKRAEQHFNKDDRFGDYLNLYRKLLERN